MSSSMRSASVMDLSWLPQAQKRPAHRIDLAGDYRQITRPVPSQATNRTVTHDQRKPAHPRRGDQEAIAGILSTVDRRDLRRLESDRLRHGRDPGPSQLQGRFEPVWRGPDHLGQDGQDQALFARRQPIPTPIWLRRTGRRCAGPLRSPLWLRLKAPSR